MSIKLSFCFITQTVFSDSRTEWFFTITIVLLLTRDPKVPNAKTLERIPSRVLGASSLSAVFTANLGSWSYEITPE